MGEQGENGFAAQQRKDLGLEGGASAAGDLVATARELDAERPHLLVLARRLVINPQDAHDLVQDAIVRALPALGRVTAGSHLRAWLLTILRRTHIDRLRRVAREPQMIPIDDMHETLTADEPAADTGDEMTPDDIRAALRRVPRSFRQVLVLHALEGRSYREISRMLGLPLATVGTRLSRARLKLRDALVTRQASKASAQRATPRGGAASTPLARGAGPLSLVGRSRPPADPPSQSACT